MSNEKMREEFERTYRLPASMQWNNETQSYEGVALFWLWMDRLEVWTASRAALCVELPEKYRVPDCELEQHYNAAIDQCRSAIESTGVRTR